MGQVPLTIRRWQRAEYDRLVELGVFEGEPLELIGGPLVVAEPKGTHHTSAVVKVDYALRAALPPGWLVRTQAPLWLDDESEPEPDLVVVDRVVELYREPVADGAAGARWGFRAPPLRECEARDRVRRRRGRRLHRLLPRQARHPHHAHRALRRGLCGFGQVGRLPGPRLVRRGVA